MKNSIQSDRCSPLLVCGALSTPAKPDFAILGSDVRHHAGDVKALADRISRTVSAGYTTTESLEQAEFHATELAAAANALADAIRKARQ